MLVFHVPKKWQYFLKDFCKVVSSSINLFFFWRVHTYILQCWFRNSTYYTRLFLLSYWHVVFWLFFWLPKAFTRKNCFFGGGNISDGYWNPKTQNLSENPTFLLPEPNPNPNPRCSTQPQLDFCCLNPSLGGNQGKEE